jgi:hypothetical protein
LASEIHTVLALEAASGYDDAGVGYIRPVRFDFIFSGRTAVGTSTDCTENSERRQQQSHLENLSAHQDLMRDDQDGVPIKPRVEMATYPVSGVDAKSVSLATSVAPRSKPVSSNRILINGNPITALGRERNHGHPRAHGSGALPNIGWSAATMCLFIPEASSPTATDEITGG